MIFFPIYAKKEQIDKITLAILISSFSHERWNNFPKIDNSYIKTKFKRTWQKCGPMATHVRLQ